MGKVLVFFIFLLQVKRGPAAKGKSNCPACSLFRKGEPAPEEGPGGFQLHELQAFHGKRHTQAETDKIRDIPPALGRKTWTRALRYCKQKCFKIVKIKGTTTTANVLISKYTSYVWNHLQLTLRGAG